MISLVKGQFRGPRLGEKISALSRPASLNDFRGTITIFSKIPARLLTLKNFVDSFIKNGKA